MNMKLSPIPPEEDSALRGGKHFVRNVLVTACVFLLFWEWLRPLTAMAELTDIHRLHPFIWAVGTYLLVDALRIPGWIGWPLKAVFTLAWVGYWFRPESLASGAWWGELISIAIADYQEVVSNEWFAISPELRTFVFLLGWAALVYAVQRIVTERSQGVWFVAATVGFLLLLQLWPGIDTNAGIMRAAAWGLLMLALLNTPKWELASGFAFSGGKRSVLSAAMAGVMLGSAVLGGGYALSASLPKQVEPVRWDSVLTWARQAGGEVRTGYGSYDGNLGASVTPDDTLAFVARSSQTAYWRGESKDVYTGRGWRNSALSDSGKVFESSSVAVGEPTMVQEVRVADEGLSEMLFAGGPVLRLTKLVSQDGKRLSDIHIRHDAETGQYYVGTDAVKLSSYSMETAAGQWDQDQLIFDYGMAPADLSRRNLQLPEGLPDRVAELAKQIVKDVPDNRLLQTLAVQRFLQENYTYSLNTQVPPNGADFVETFLFEDHVGYCNHFSTAMVVLLRSIGIESRWVKGFAPGSLQAGSADTYEVRLSDAHSWVEVYFPETGWVPFEATPGFGEAAPSPHSSNEVMTAGNTTLLAVNMMLPISVGRAASLDIAAATAVKNEVVTANAQSGQSETDGVQSGLLGWLESAKRLWADAAAALNDLKQWYSNAALQEKRLPAALFGLSAVFVLAVAVAFIVRGAAKRRGMNRGLVSPRDAASAAALAKLDAFWLRLYRRYGSRPADRTLREYVSGLPEQRREALEELLRYDERVRFGTDRGRRATREWLDDVWRKVSE